MVEFLIEHMTPKIKAIYSRQLAVVKGLIMGQQNINGTIRRSSLESSLREVTVLFASFQLSLPRTLMTRATPYE